MGMVIIVPYRDRRQHLGQFVKHYSDFDIVIVEQLGSAPFNRAKLLNVGFLEAGIYDHYIFSDIDMLAEEKIFKEYEVAHLAGAASQFRYRQPYPTYFGGVCMFSREAFVKCNGYSNNFWGWGSEDDEMYNNVVNTGYTVEFVAKRFKSLSHRPADRSHHSKNILLNLAGRQSDDGLNHCQYKVEKTETGNYKHIYVSI